jgi:hypothetical protein
MILSTQFNLGDKVFSSYGNVVEELTIGQVRKCVTKSAGIPGETLFDNYKEQEGEKEEYMCVETGIGSGAVYDGGRIFRTKEEAENKRKEIAAAQENSQSVLP